MPLVNHAKREINVKVVWFGAAGSGKQAALTYMHSRVRPSLRGELKSPGTAGDNLLCFDFSPFEAPLANGYRVRFHMYTLSGRVANPAAWKMTLKGVDGVVVMAGSNAEQQLAESVVQLRDYLGAYGVSLHDVPCVVQLNGDSPSNSVQLVELLGLTGCPVLATDVSNGSGVLEVLNAISRLVVERVAVTQSGPVDQPLDESTGEFDEEYEVVAEQPGSPNDKPMNNDDVPYVNLVKNEVVADKHGRLKIPIEVGQGAARRRLVVTISVETE